MPTSVNWSGQSPSRQRILEAFLHLAIIHGFNAVSMRMIGSAVNIKAPSVYSHFPNGRDEIVAESLRWNLHKFAVAVLDGVTGTASAVEFWDALVRVHLLRQLQLPERDLWDLLVATDRAAHFLPAELRAELDDWVDSYEGMYRSAARDMGFDDPAESVRVVMTLLEGANRWCQWSGDDADLPALVERAVALTHAVMGLSR